MTQKIINKIKMSFYKLIKKSIFILFTIMGVSCIAQEQLMPLSRNINLPVITDNKLLSKTTASITPLNLPFFDDFSYAYKSPYPSANNWLDSNTYVNTGFAIAPITLGVATFDGLNKLGFPYNINASVNSSTSADTLSSVPINLQSTATHTYSPADSIYISFYYQAEGNGEAPEATDSLCLDFKKVNQNKWQKVWGVKGYNPSANDTNFYRVRIPIADTAYCDSLFQFRFRNKATTSGSLDHWHIDYVQIKQNYFINDTILDDVSYAYKSTSFLKNYFVMPYRQYNGTLERAAGFHNYFRSNFNAAKFSVYDYTVKDEFNATIPSNPYGTFPTGILPYAPTLNQGYYTGNAANPIFSYTGSLFPATLPSPTFFTIQHVITTSGDTKRENDTLTQIQKFSNYYAYDDGSAELGYYTNTYGAKLACRFTLNVLDTLKSVRVYFDPIINGSLIPGSTFRLMVWNSTGSGPGSLVYKDSLMHPSYISGCYNLMPLYNLTSCLPLSVGTYYIGIQQTTNLGLNIGFDVNTDHKDALYYDTGTGWTQSTIKGSIMINPVMGCAINTPIIDCNTPAVGIKEYKKNDKISLFPNPAQNFLTISFSGNQTEIVTADFYTSLGQLVYTKSIISNEQIDISNLSNGLYFIHLKGSNLNVSAQKLIISK
jgi:hypothetical protein